MHYESSVFFFAGTVPKLQGLYMMEKTPVPTRIGIPKITRSLTPMMWSLRPCSAASNRWPAVFSKDASVSTDSFIFSIPNRVIPNTCPLNLPLTPLLKHYVMQSANSI